MPYVFYSFLYEFRMYVDIQCGQHIQAD